ncbi:hypothetical protein FE257_003199 [Aspergillus nanangensis]|uniref:Uncharacterized protein n=1 Tax=Aspergillus nanangensis TaxID=2582783 RepID=A0AAD4CBR9_ASPNN|nr:hypothetical protein FE257_003199 [Aspergillus nanangensis]
MRFAAPVLAEDSEGRSHGQSQEFGHVLKEPSTAQHTTGDAVGPKAALTNPLAFHMTDWVPGPKGKPVFMGMLSSWSFRRRVLEITYKRVKLIAISG